MATQVKPHKHLEGVRRFNRSVFNHLTMLFAGHFFYAVVNHVGRRSGKAYRTPIVAERAPGGFLIPLPYGDDTDWCLNILAAGGCTLQHDGRRYPLTLPRVVEADEALPLLKPAKRAAFRLFKIGKYLRLDHPGA